MFNNVSVYRLSFRTFLAGSVFVLLAGCLTNSAVVEETVIEAPQIDGVWANALLTPDDERWRIEDLACSRTGCSLTGFTYLQSLLNDPNNDERSVKELYYDMREYEKTQNVDLLTELGLEKQTDYTPSEGAALDCKPDGDSLRHQILAPVPMQIEQFDDKVVFRYEYWNAVRTAYLDGRPAPEGMTASRLGHSVAHYEGQTLIVKTTNVIANVTGIPGGGAFAPSPDTVYVERYTHNPGDGRLDLELTLIDPVHFRKPYGNQRSYLPAPDWELDEFVCEAFTGEF
jgi:hypothetical protein